MILNRLGKWPLKPQHVAALKRRGLTDEAISQRGYVSIDGRAGMVAKWWENTLKAGKVEGLETTSFDDLTKLIPGIMRDQNGVPRFARLSGLVVPVRDLQGLIVALKIRRDDSDLKATANKALPKYHYFSASRNEREERRKRDGVVYPKAEAAVHVPHGAPSTSDTVRVTEGELKSDVATELSGVLTISIPGVGMWERALPVLKSLVTKRVLIALDADHNENPEVARALAGLARRCAADGYVVALEIWNIEHGKGLDDLLVAGHQPTVLEGDALTSYLADHVDPIANNPTSGDGDTTPANSAKGDPSVGSDIDDSSEPPPFQPFPTTLFPSPISDYIRAAGSAMGCDESYIVLPLLAGLAAAVGGTRRIRLKRSWSEPCVFWAVIVGASGTMKSPALEAAVSQLRHKQTMAFRTYKSAEADYKVQLKTHEVALTKWKKDGHKTFEPPPTEPEAPICDRWIVEDATVEAVAPILEANPRGVIVVRDELSGWVNSFDGYKATRGADVAHWLSMHRAGTLLVDRKTGQRIIHVPRAAVSVTGGIQPGTLMSALGGRGIDEAGGGPQLSVEHIENGLAARLLMTMPPAKAKQWSDADIDPELDASVSRIFEWLSGLEFHVDENGEDQPVDLSLTPEAKDRWIVFYNEHASETIELGGATAAAWSKLEGYAARFALLIHLLRQASGLSSNSRIELEDIDAGIELSRWCGYETRRIYAQLGIDSASNDDLEQMTARRIAKIVANHGGLLTARGLQRASRQYRGNAESAEQALKLAERLGFLSSRFNSTTGGRPVVEYRLTGTESPLSPVVGDTTSTFFEIDEPSVTVTTDQSDIATSDDESAGSSTWGEV